MIEPPGRSSGVILICGHQASNHQNQLDGPLRKSGGVWALIGSHADQWNNGTAGDAVMSRRPAVKREAEEEWGR
jgi:hypothetical protein